MGRGKIHIMNLSCKSNPPRALPLYPNRDPKSHPNIASPSISDLRAGPVTRTRRRLGPD